MAEEKKKDGDGKTETPKKKGLPAIVMVAIGAIVGGAGVVFAVPPKTVEVKVPEQLPEDVEFRHPDVIKHEFNPRSKAGKGIGSVALRFRYVAREDREAAAFEQIKEHWDLANSNVLLILKTRSFEDLQSEQGIRALEKDIVDDLDRTLFPPVNGTKLARVTRLTWDRWLVQ